MGSPLAEADGKSDAVAVVTSEDHYFFAARVAAEDGAHSFGEENRAAPAVRDAHGMQSRVQIANTGFEPAKTGGGFPLADIETAQIKRGVFVGAAADWIAEKRAQGSWHGDEAGAEDDTNRIEQTAPQIGQVDGVKRAARGAADGSKLCGGERRGGERKSQFRLGGAVQSCEFQGEGVRGEEDLTDADFFAVDAAARFVADLQAQRIREIDGVNMGALGDLRPGLFRRASQASQDFARINGAAGDDADDFQFAGIVPRDW